VRSIHRATAGLALALSLGAAGASAQTRAVVPRSGAMPAAMASMANEHDLRGRFGVPWAKKLLASQDANERVRGVERLGALGTPEAVDALLAAFEPGAVLLRDPTTRLAVVRAIAPQAGRDPVRTVLVRELTDPSPEGRSMPSPLAALTRDAAAMALAQANEKKAAAALATAIQQGGAIGAAAERALLGHPPSSVDMILVANEPMGPSMARFLGDLGDLRAIPRLRSALQSGDAATQAAAAFALARLGDAAAIERAVAWIDSGDRALNMAAAEVLARLDSPYATRAVTNLLASDVSLELTFGLVRALPVRGLTDALSAACARSQTRPIKLACVIALGVRAETPGPLEALLADADEEVATDAALGLARRPGPAFRAAIERALSRAKGEGGPALRRAARSAIVRALSLGDVVADLEPTLLRMVASSDATDRSIGAFGLVALGLRDPRAWLAGDDDAVAIAAARALVARGAAPASEARALLRSANKRRVVAGGVALLDADSARGVSDDVLVAWAEEGGALAGLAARALAARTTPIARLETERLLQGTDVLVRQHAALGLGESEREDAGARLARAYRTEDNADVRLAIVRGLVRTSSRAADDTLRLALALDSDARVQSLAKAAESVGPQPRDRRGDGVAWVSLAPHGGASGAVVRSDGLAIPFVADPDGVALIPGLFAGQGSLTLAIPFDSGDDPER
jgi:HEAT repeat protein